MNKETKYSIAVLACLAIIVSGVCLFAPKSEAGYPRFETGQKVVASKGTPVPLATSTVPLDVSVIIKAKTANTGIIYLASSANDALNSKDGHFKLYPGESVALKVSNLNAIWFDGESGEGVEYILEND